MEILRGKISGRMIGEMLKSAWQIGRQVMFGGRRPDVVFYYPRLFNRSERGDNPFFAPLLEICQRHGIKCLVIEETEGRKGNFPANPRSMNGCAFFWFVWLFQTVMRKGLGWTQHRCDRQIGRIFDAMTFHRFRAKTYVTISNAKVDVLGDINPKGTVYDFQHGIIYFGHEGYFDERNVLRETFLLANRKVLLWGPLYLENLVTASGGMVGKDKMIAVGYPMYQQREAQADVNKKPIVLVSLQFASLTPERNQACLKMLAGFIEEAKGAGYSVLLKHHPRFADEVDLTPLLADPMVALTAEPLDELAQRVRLHVTWGSTTTFEYASYGIPTLFLMDDVLDWATEVFYHQYRYPLYRGMPVRRVLERALDGRLYAADSAEVKGWYEKAYAPLDEDLLVRIFRGEDVFSNLQKIIW